MNSNFHRFTAVLRYSCPRLLGLALLMAATISPMWGQDAVDRAIGHMPSNSVLSVTVWPAQLSQKESMALAPLEVFSAAGLEQFGLDPLKIERLDLLFPMPGPQQPEFGALIQFTDPFSLEQLKPQLLEDPNPQNEGGVDFYRIAAREFTNLELRLHVIDEKSVILGTANFARQMLRTEGDGRIAQLVSQIRSSQDAMLVIDVQTLRPLMQGVVEGQARGLPAEVTKSLLSTLEGTDFLAFRAVMDIPETLQLVLVSPNEATASRTLGSITELLDFAEQNLVASAKSEFPQQTKTGQAAHAYIDRVARTVRAALTPELMGSRIVLEVEDVRNAGTVGTLTALLLPAVSSARQAARRQQSMNNLKQLMLAFLNFESAYQTFPAAAGLDDQDQPMLSWRVAILPFIEEVELFQKFRLDEPWDSEHNLALLSEMPDVFKHPSKATEAGHTVYQVAVGEATLMRLKEPTRMGQVTDGLSNTIMIVEVPAEDAVPWTAPRDFEVDLDNPVERLFGDAETTQVGIADGSVRVLSKAIDLELLRALFTRAGGEVVDF